MKKLSKTLFLILLAGLFAAVSACGTSGPRPEASPEPSSGQEAQADPTSAPSALPAETADDQPTEAAPTPGQYPYYQQAFVESVESLPFDSCAEKVLSLAPNGPGPYYYFDLPDSGEGGPAPVFGPTWFSVDSNTVYVSDGGMGEDVRGTLFAYDLSSGAASRISIGSTVYGYIPMIVDGGTLYTCRSAEDLSTGAVTELEEAVTPHDEVNSTAIMTAFDGTVRYLITGGPNEEEDEANCTVFTLDSTAGTWSDSVLSPGFLEGLTCKFNLAGIFPNGDYCFVIEYESDPEKDALVHIVRVNASMEPIVAVTVPYTSSQYAPLGYSFRAITARDGFVYFMACFEEEFAVWKIALK